MKITIKESDILRVVNLVMEQMDLHDYDDTDFTEVFFLHFRPWLSKKYGESIFKYPISFLIKKYGYKFAHEISPENYRENDDKILHRWDLSRVGREIVEKQLHKLPSLYSEEKFTEKYAKITPTAMERLGLPDFISYEIFEPKPNQVTIKLISDFSKRVKSEKPRQPSGTHYRQKLEQFFENYIGVEFGNRAYGEVDLRVDDPKTIGEEEWKKGFFKKEIRPKISAMDPKKQIHSLRFNLLDSDRPEIKVVFKDNYVMNVERRALLENIKELIKNSGLNIRITN